MLFAFVSYFCCSCTCLGFLDPFFSRAGRKSVLMLGAQPDIHETVRNMFDEVLSPKAVLKLRPFVEACLEERALAWEKLAQTGEVTILFACLDVMSIR